MRSDYIVYKGKIGYYVLTDKIALLYADGKWKMIEILDGTDPCWLWVASDVAVNAQEVTDLELLVVTGTSKKELQKRLSDARQNKCRST